ncbi:uncharacterized protein LOC131658851 [Vicia villosa]|uniref:uncharacterized protein LOC131658851 n=1 Tax=Vicia villosa TaxID=3911 RepID=UPI00273C2C8C|nr:uncharacterized protein LOC131658851 [Vicia villosa]
MAEQQVVRGFRAPRRQTGRASTGVAEEQVAQVEVAEVKEPVPEVGELVAIAEVPVPIAEEGVAEDPERLVLEIDTTTGASTEPLVHTDGAYYGGPSDRSVLTGYADHVAYRIWQGEEDSSGLPYDGLCWMLPDDTGRLSIIERWHPETPSFHLPFGKMTVTLDDMHSQFHLLIAGMFFTPVHRDQVTAVDMVMKAFEIDEVVVLKEQVTAVHMVMKSFEIDEVVVLKEFGETHGFHLRMFWLRKIYQELADAGRYEAAARVYMLHLVACTLFADKSRVYIEVGYLSLFSALDTPCWAWEVAALTLMYTTLDDASYPDTRQLAAADPCAKRWKAKQAIPGGLVEYTRRLEALTLDDVIWTPYADHHAHCPFDVSSLYLGCVRWESHVAIHVPERFLHQYGYIQGIPCQVPEALAGGIEGWITPSAAASDVPGPSRTKVSSDPPPSPPPPAGDQDSRLQFITVNLDSLMGLVNPNGEFHSILARFVDVARGGPM